MMNNKVLSADELIYVWCLLKASTHFCSPALDACCGMRVFSTADLSGIIGICPKSLTPHHIWSPCAFRDLFPQQLRLFAGGLLLVCGEWVVPLLPNPFV